ncbi:MAG TPA: sporulation-delaying protein SdpB family protein [Bacilli bacterium]|nr:sporulation-delaying protein SdpB family protein [Bacilli bacterium]
MSKLNDRLIQYCITNNPFTNVYGLARTLLALSTFLLFLFNRSNWLFRPAQGVPEIDITHNLIYKFSLFGLLSDHLEIARWIAVLLMLIVMSGWRPRITGLIHFWVACSVFNDAMVLDGGEQVLTVITLILLPVTLMDNRKWHWSTPETHPDSTSYLYRSMCAHIFLTFARLQLAMIYVQAAIERLKNPEWQDGTATYYFFQVPMLGMTDSMKAIVNPILTSPAVFYITWGTTVVELLLAFGFLAQKKRWKFFLVAGILLHFGIALLLGLWTFSLTMSACLIISYVPEEKMLAFKWVRKWFARKSYPVQLENNPA